MAMRELVQVTSWDAIGPTLDAGKRAYIEFTCGLCKQRVAEEFHSTTVTTYHQVAEEDVTRLRAEVATLTARAAAAEAALSELRLQLAADAL